MNVMLVCGLPTESAQVESMMQERSVFSGHTEVRLSAIEMLQVLVVVLRRHKRRWGQNWRMDDPYMTVSDHRKFLFLARDGDRADFHLAAKCHLATVWRFLECTT